MRLTKNQLRRIIIELHPRDVVDAEYDEELFDLGDVYADMHKEYHGRKPKGPMFKTHEEAINAIDDLSAALKRKYEKEDELTAQYLEDERHARELQGLMPDEYDIELPKQSGHGRRSESYAIKTTISGLRTIINEIVSEESAPLSMKVPHKVVSESVLRKVIREAINLNLNKGDIILTGKFKNKRTVIQDIGKDKNGHPTVNGKSILRFKIEKLLPKEEWSKTSRNKQEK